MISQIFQRGQQTYAVDENNKLFTYDQITESFKPTGYTYPSKGVCILQDSGVLYTEYVVRQNSVGLSKCSIVTDSNGLFGLIDSKGTLLLDVKYSSIEFDYEGIFFVVTRTEKGIIKKGVFKDNALLSEWIDDGSKVFGVFNGNISSVKYEKKGNKTICNVYVNGAKVFEEPGVEFVYQIVPNYFFFGKRMVKRPEYPTVCGICDLHGNRLSGYDFEIPFITEPFLYNAVFDGKVVIDKWKIDNAEVKNLMINSPKPQYQCVLDENGHEIPGLKVDDVRTDRLKVKQIDGKTHISSVDNSIRIVSDDPTITDAKETFGFIEIKDNSRNKGVMDKNGEYIIKPNDVFERLLNSTLVEYATKRGSSSYNIFHINGSEPLLSDVCVQRLAPDPIAGYFICENKKNLKGAIKSDGSKIIKSRYSELIFLSPNKYIAKINPTDEYEIFTI